MSTARNAGTTSSPSPPQPRRGRHTVRATPLPVGRLTILCIVLLTESVCSTMMIPFVGLYVSFMQNWPKEKAGYSSGFLIGLFMLGQVISSKMFGHVSDKYGRKICIAVGVFLCAVAMFFFGLSTNIWLACLWRFVHGLFAGCSLAAKTMISDVTDRTNQAKGFALVSLTWGVGTLFGPALGGFLYDPVHKPALAPLHLREHGFLARFPAFLPSFIASMYNLLAVGVCVLFLRETNRQAVPLHTMLPSSSWVARRVRPLLDIVQPRLPAAHDVTIVVPPSSSHDATAKPAADEDNHNNNNNNNNNVHDIEQRAREPSKPARPPSFGFKQAFQRPLTRNVCIMSMLISGADMLYAETFALWGIVSLADGGLDLGSDQVGILILVNSVPAVLANVYFATVLSRFASQMNYWRLTQCMYALLSAIVPLAPYLGKNAGYWYTMLVGIVRKVWETWTFAMIMLTVAQTAPPGKIGVMYGVQQATACMVRCIVPFVGAPLFAWSVQAPHPFPFNHFLLFLLSSIPLLVSVAVSFRVHIPRDPADDDKQHASERHHEQQHDDDNAAHHEQQSQHQVGVTTTTTTSSAGADNYSHHHDDDDDDAQPISVLTNRSFGSTSRHGTADAARSLNNSFALLANSFASNPISSMLHRNIMPVNPDHVQLKDDDDDDEDNNEADRRRDDGDNAAPSSDSREASSALDDDDDDDELRFQRFVPRSPSSSASADRPQTQQQQRPMHQQQQQQAAEAVSAAAVAVAMRRRTAHSVDVEDAREHGDDDELPHVSSAPMVPHYTT